MTTKEQIRELYDKGASVEEIAEVTNMRMRTIQTTIRMIEKEQDPIEKGAVKVANKTNKQIVEELVEKGLGAQEIHKKTGIPIASVYSYSSNYRKSLEKAPAEKEKVDPVENEQAEMIESIVKRAESIKESELEGINKKLKKNINELETEKDDALHLADDLKAEVERLKEDKVELHIKNGKLEKELSKRETVETVNELNKALELLQHNYSEQSRDIKLMQEMINEKNEVINELKESIKSEQNNHSLLFKYMVGVAEAS